MGNRVQKRGEIISQEQRQLVSLRYHTITKAINASFWGETSDTAHSIYVGSYGRGTAVSTSDIDILVQLPSEYYDKYNGISGNGQSRLLQAVKNSILESYPRTDVSGDGQVVVCNFKDGIILEVLPAFKTTAGRFLFPNTHNGGAWESTDPKAEQDAMLEKNRSSNGLLFDTCKHIRCIRDESYSSYTLSGIVIDSFAYHAIAGWRWCPPGESGASAGTYESVLMNYYSGLSRFSNLSAPGSGEIISIADSYDCLGKVLRSML